MDWFHPTHCAVNLSLTPASRSIGDVSLSPPSGTTDVWTIERLSNGYSVSFPGYEEAASWANRLLNRDRCGPAVRKVLRDVTIATQEF